MFLATFEGDLVTLIGRLAGGSALGFGTQRTTIDIAPVTRGANESLSAASRTQVKTSSNIHRHFVPMRARLAPYKLA